MPVGFAEYLDLTPRLKLGNHAVVDSYRVTMFPPTHPKYNILDLETPSGIVTIKSAREVKNHVEKIDVETLVVACYALAICSLNWESHDNVISAELLKSTSDDIKHDLGFSPSRSIREWQASRVSPLGYYGVTLIEMIRKAGSEVITW